MGVIDAPQWLLPAYVRSVRALGASASAETIGQSGKTLIDMWSSPDRHFHNLKHAINMLARVDELADESHDPDVMRLAAWYHGCVFSSASEQTYKRNGGEDEVASAAYAARDLHRLGLPDATVDRICALILNLKHRSLPRNDIDALALNDADLGTLAVEPQQYKRYRQMVREEYAHIPVEDYLRARLTIITRLLDREMLFSSPLGQRWERPARQNLQAEKQRLTDELARARRREEEAKQSKKDLVAELGHDIRTPVASIAATAELLALTETDAARRSKLETVGDLTGQIEALVADLFQANEEELAVLRVEPEVVASGEVAALLRAADPDGAIRPFDLPGCLVSVDRLRMRQVFDNVVANSRKYAATPVTVASRLEGDFLVVDVRDTGPGVPSGELEAILGKGVRGSNAAGRPGQGLGLFTASYLMERMGGSLHCRDAAPGLGVVVEIPLAR